MENSPMLESRAEIVDDDVCGNIPACAIVCCIADAGMRKKRSVLLGPLRDPCLA